jgi:polar amino acid transport system substrate-binding protein
MLKLVGLRFSRRVMAAAAVLALAGGGFAGSSKAADLELVEAGKLTVAFNGDMPGTGWQDGHLVGLDGEVMQLIAEELGLKVQPALMEWAAEIASVKAGRVDIMHGMMGWNDQRIKVINISDPIYYGGANITQKKSTNWSTVKELEGKTIATIQGFGWIDQLKAIEGSTLKLYDTSDAAIRDLLAGRIEALFADPPLIQYAITKNPDWDIHSVAITQDFDEKYSLLTGKYNVVFGLNQEAPELLKAVNAKIAEIWASCKNLEIAKKYGLGNKSWFDPGSLNLRAGVDRPKDWTQPTLPANCS